MLYHHLPFQYFDALIERRFPRPARHEELALRRAARRRRARR